MTSLTQQREDLKTQLIEILGEPLPSEKPSMATGWRWERVSRKFEVACVNDKFNVFVNGKCKAIETEADTCVELARYFGRFTQSEV